MIKNIVLDYGHGGIDENGNYTTAPKKMATLSNGEVAYEGVLNREIGKKVFDYLCEHCKEVNTYQTVEWDDPRDISLRDRVYRVHDFPYKETILVSIHCNAFNGKARGFELYTTKGYTQSDELAESIANEVEVLYKELELKLRFDLTDGDKDKEIDFYVLRKVACPAVLLECLFFDNDDDYALLKEEAFQKELAFAIYKGIVNFIKNN